MIEPSFSFVELDRRLRAMPDGPASVLNTPRWIFVLDFVGWAGLIAGLIPSLLIHFLEPKIWMVWMARAGLWVALLTFAPGFVRGAVVVVRSMLRWQTGQVQQMDHDLVQYRDLRRWLAQFPAEASSEALRFVRQGQERISAKLGLIAGSVHNLGILPMLVALAIQLKAIGQWGQTPGWQIELALFLAIFYLIGFVAALMRLRLQLYELVLTDSLAARGIMG
jgi:hypothetical protein